MQIIDEKISNLKIFATLKILNCNFSFKVHWFSIFMISFVALLFFLLIKINLKQKDQI